MPAICTKKIHLFVVLVVWWCWWWLLWFPILYLSFCSICFCHCHRLLRLRLCVFFFVFTVFTVLELLLYLWIKWWMCQCIIAWKWWAHFRFHSFCFCCITQYRFVASITPTGMAFMSMQCHAIYLFRAIYV